MVGYLKELVSLKREEMGIKDHNSGSSFNKQYKTFGDITSYSGMPDLRSYATLVQKRVTDNISSIMSLNESFGEDSNMLMQMAISPLAFLPKAAVSKIIGSTIKKSAKNLDKTVSGVFGSLIAKINEVADESPFGSVTGMLAEYLAVSNTLKTAKSIDTSKYEKGNMPWNGKAQKALIEVIPTLLSKQLAVMSGQAEMLYDYDKGKFIRSKDVRKDFNRRRENEINMAFYDVKEGMDNIMKTINLEFEDASSKKDFDVAYKKFFEYFFKSNKRFDPNSKDYNYYSGMGVSRQNYEILASVFNQLDPSLKMGFDRGILMHH